jgi:hypothetical protein
MIRCGSVEMIDMWEVAGRGSWDEGPGEYHIERKSWRRRGRREV